MAAAEIDVAAEAEAARARRAVAAACAGNMVEWYDFAVFGAFAAVIGTVYFPTADESTRLLAAFAVYGTAFVVRPWGAVVFGRRGDRQGRRSLLVVAILLMSLATAAVGLLPGYATIGLMAPILLILLRATQGFGAGGELGIAAVLVVEHAPDGRRGAYAAWHTATLALGIAAGLGVGAAAAALLTDAQLLDGWWRLAFVAALPLGLVGLHLRRRLPEALIFSELPVDRLIRNPFRATFTHYRSEVRAGFILAAAGSLAFNTFFIFWPNHVAEASDVTLPAALSVAVVGLLVGAMTAVFCGRLSDRTGRRPVVLTGSAVLAVAATPLSIASGTNSLLALTVAELLTGVAIGSMLSFALIAELFPTELRSSAMAMTAGLGSALVGGTAPLIEQAVVKVTSIDWLPGLYVSAFAGLAFWEMWRRPETAFDPLA